MLIHINGIGKLSFNAYRVTTIAVIDDWQDSFAYQRFINFALPNGLLPQVTCSVATLKAKDCENVGGWFGRCISLKCSHLSVCFALKCNV